MTALTHEQDWERTLAIARHDTHFREKPDFPVTYYQRSVPMPYMSLSYDEVVYFDAVRWSITWGTSKGIGVSLEGTGIVLVDPLDESSFDVRSETALYYQEFDNLWTLFTLLPLDPRMFE